MTLLCVPLIDIAACKRLPPIIVPLGQLREQLFHPTPVGLEATDHLPVDHQCSRGPAFPLIHQLVVGAGIRLDVLPLIGNTLLPKELLGSPAIPSTGLVVQNHLLHRLFLPCSWAQAALYMGEPASAASAVRASDSNSRCASALSLLP
jgi:hypothetical protein